MDGGSARYYFIPRGGMHPLFGLSPEHGALYQVPPPPDTPFTFGGEGVAVLSDGCCLSLPV